MPKPPELGPGQHAPADNGNVHSHLVYPLTDLVWQDAASTSSSICCSVALFPAEHRLTQSGIGAQAVADGHVGCGAEHDAEHSAGKSLSSMPVPPQLGPGKHATADNCSAHSHLVYPLVNSVWQDADSHQQLQTLLSCPLPCRTSAQTTRPQGGSSRKWTCQTRGRMQARTALLPAARALDRAILLQWHQQICTSAVAVAALFLWAPWASTLRKGPVAHLLQLPCRSMLKYLFACQSLGQNTLAYVGSGNSVDMGRKLLQMAQNAGQNTLHQVRVVPPCAACTVA